MQPIYIDISAFRANLSKIAEDVFLFGKTYVVKRSDIPILEVRKVDAKKNRIDPWEGVIGGWSKYMTDEEADELVKEIYKLRKDGSSKKKYLYEPK